MTKACLIDISRGRVPTLERMKKLLYNISGYGYQQVFLNIEHTLKIKKHPLIGKEADGFHEEEFKTLDEYAYQHNLELIPVFQSFGHMFHILKLDQYQNLSESSDLWSINLIDEEVYQFLFDYYEAIAHTFRTQWIHVGGDEIYDLGLGKSKGLLNHKSKTELFFSHIAKLKDMINKLDRKMMIWGDMIEKETVHIDQLGEDVTICYWNYDFTPIPKTYQNLNNQLYFCPGISTWKNIFIRYEYAAKNINYLKDNFKNFPVDGWMITDWGDGGHPHPISFTEKMFEYTMNIMTTPEKAFSFSKNGQINQVIHLLNEIHHGLDFEGEYFREIQLYATNLLFFEYPYQGEAFLNVPHQLLIEKIKKTEQLKELVKECSAFQTEFEKDLLLVIDKTNLLAEKINLFLSYQQKKPYGQIKQLTNDFIIHLRKYFSQFMANWLATSQPMGLYFHIHFFKQLELDLLKDLEKYQQNMTSQRGHDFQQTILAQSEYHNLFTICHFDALKDLWNNYRL
ncbi:MAG: family 20 glycosylhydrolase [Spirochaetes bacterium]|nr:family 20 glycosylhydrolase [Spirochaetota bacterium]